MTWLLIVSISTFTANGGRGVSTILVTETQCKATVAHAPKWLNAICVSPAGEVFK